MTTIHRFNPFAAHQPKFGVSFQTKYSPNLSAQDLQDALELRRLQDSEAPRIRTIPDQKDPFKINVNVQPGELSAEVKTEQNGSFTVIRQGQAQPVVAFFNDILANLAQIAPSLKTQEERKQEAPQLANQLISQTLEALEKNPEIIQGAIKKGLCQTYEIPANADTHSPPLNIQLTRANMPHCPKLIFSIIEQPHTGSSSSRLDFRITADDKAHIDFGSTLVPKVAISEKLHPKASVEELSQRITDLIARLESHQPN